jgi:hypothetical protein
LLSEVDEAMPLMRNAELHVSISTSTESGFVTDIKAEQIGKSADIVSAVATLEAQAKHIAFQPIPIRDHECPADAYGCGYSSCSLGNSRAGSPKRRLRLPMSSRDSRLQAQQSPMDYGKHDTSRRCSRA